MKLYEYVLIGLATMVIFTTAACVLGYMPDVNQIKLEQKKLNTYIEMNKRYKPLD